jgi:selT/selW/selH-like putative selenoprotein
VNVKILFCEMCGGRGTAQAAADELKKYMGIDAVLEDVGKGRFEVVVEGRTVYSKASSGQFPKPMELVKLLRSGK